MNVTRHSKSRLASLFWLWTELLWMYLLFTGTRTAALSGLPSVGVKRSGPPLAAIVAESLDVRLMKWVLNPDTEPGECSLSLCAEQAGMTRIRSSCSCFHPSSSLMAPIHLCSFIWAHYHSTIVFTPQPGCLEPKTLFSPQISQQADSLFMKLKSQTGFSDRFCLKWVKFWMWETVILVASHKMEDSSSN